MVAEGAARRGDNVARCAHGPEDLAPARLERALGLRAVRTYPALLSTHADALAWARAGAPAGAVVVADYQAAPRGRGGLTWEVTAGEGLGFSLVLHPGLDPEREGWLYAVAVSGLADAAGDGSTIRWPDEVVLAGRRWAAVGAHAELGATAVDWAVVTVLVPGAQPPRDELLVEVVGAIEERAGADPGAVLEDYRARCATLGSDVSAHLMPVGPAGGAISGRAVDVKDDGALVIETAEGRRVAVRPQHLGLLEPD